VTAIFGLGEFLRVIFYQLNEGGEYDKLRNFVSGGELIHGMLSRDKF
jgi:hypothetical protein